MHLLLQCVLTHLRSLLGYMYCVCVYVRACVCVLTMLLELTARARHTKLSIGLTGRRTAEAGSTLMDRDKKIVTEMVI